MSGIIEIVLPPNASSRNDRHRSLAAPDPKARAFLRNADPVLAAGDRCAAGLPSPRLARPAPALGAFGTLIFQVAGQQLSVRATRTIVSRLEDHFGGRLPSPAELLAADPQELAPAACLLARARRCARSRSASSTDASATRRSSRMTDDEVEAALTEVPESGLDSARLPDRGARPARRAPVRRPRAAARDSGGVRIRPSPDRRRDGPDGGALAAVSEPRGELPLRVRIRGEP